MKAGFVYAEMLNSDTELQISPRTRLVVLKTGLLAQTTTTYKDQIPVELSTS